MTVLTREQRTAVHTLFTRNANGSKTYREFRRRVRPQIGGYACIPDWCGMYVGIEKDGHTHT